MGGMTAATIIHNDSMQKFVLYVVAMLLLSFSLFIIAVRPVLFVVAERSTAANFCYEALWVNCLCIGCIRFSDFTLQETFDLHFDLLTSLDRICVSYMLEQPLNELMHSYECQNVQSLEMRLA